LKKRKTKQEKSGRGRLALVALTALGVVYGDIGTSPLYALRECFRGQHSVPATPENVLGVLSLIFWALVLVISLKYLVLILRADNHGEGGILALMELVVPEGGRSRVVIIGVGLFGAALLYGDGTITPAISVLSAVEGLQVATQVFDPYIIPITLGILLALFSLQYRGTEKVGLLFGPVMAIWFLVIAATGVSGVVRNPQVLAAVNPVHAIEFIFNHGIESLYILGAVFLVVTGGEALYADIGHFGRSPIRISWFMAVLPCLMLNYFGQGGLLLASRQAAENPFYHLVPGWGLYPMVGLATIATVIASQAIISGVFSLTFQALQLGYLPRLQVLHTSSEQRGQVFIPRVNWILFLATAAVVVGFKTSGNLAAAYGVAVATTMVITTMLGYVAMTRIWNWNWIVAGLVAGTFLIIDLLFFSANLLKVAQGGWYPLCLAAAVYLLMSTWRKGQAELAAGIADHVKPVKSFIEDFDFRRVTRVSGSAIYLTATPLTTPSAFMHNLVHNKTVHRNVFFVSIGFKNLPYVSAEDRVQVQELPKGFYRVLVRYGFMDRADLSAIIRVLRNRDFDIDMDDTTIFVSRETPILKKSPGRLRLRKRFFILMLRNAEPVTRYFNLPVDKVFEVGVQLKI